MHLKSVNHVKTVTPSKGWIRKYKNNPSDQHLAVMAALQIARNLEKPVVLIKGNSYGTVVYHIAETGDSIGKYVPGAWPCNVLLIRTTGEIFRAVAED